MAIATSDPIAAKVAGTLPEQKFYMHSPLLYWWPVWAVGLCMALWTGVDNSHMALVPEGTVVVDNTLVAPEGTTLGSPSVHVARSRVPGVVFALTLLAVIVFSHLWLRGVWALFGVACFAAAVFLVNWLEWWNPLHRWFGLLHVHINLGGYLVIAVPLLAAWALAVFVFDRRTYVVFSAGQVRVHDELGEQERVFDTGSIALEKRPYDWFRWLVGFGAGDMLVRVGAPQPQVIEVPNVVRVGKRLREVEDRLRIRDVV